jgi:hypothetical protein
MSLATPESIRKLQRKLYRNLAVRTAAVRC